jgi:hypothetical protein
MTMHRRITGFVAIALLAAVTTAASVRSRNPMGTPRVSEATQAALEGAGGSQPEPIVGLRKPVRYEAIIENWKRHRAASKPNG